MRTRALPLAAAAILLASPATGQDIRSRVSAAPDGFVRLSYATRPDVCGHGTNISVRSDRRDGWESDCAHGPARLSLEVRGGRVVRMRTYVGGRWRDIEERVTDLGMVRATQAVDYLLDLAEREPSLRGGPIFAATIADSASVWPRLLRLARNTDVAAETRRQAVFWLSQDAAEAATRGLADLVGDEAQDRDVREHAVFALSQLRDGGGIDALLRVARTDRDPRIRKRAIFWLGQSRDPRALAFFEELLTAR